MGILTAALNLRYWAKTMVIDHHLQVDCGTACYSLCCMSGKRPLSFQFTFLFHVSMAGGHHGGWRILERGSSDEGGQTPEPCPAARSVFMNVTDCVLLLNFICLINSHPLFNSHLVQNLILLVVIAVSLSCHTCLLKWHYLCALQACVPWSLRFIL